MDCIHQEGTRCWIFKNPNAHCYYKDKDQCFEYLRIREKRKKHEMPFK